MELEVTELLSLSNVSAGIDESQDHLYLSQQETYVRGLKDKLREKFRKGEGEYYDEEDN